MLPDHRDRFQLGGMTVEFEIEIFEIGNYGGASVLVNGAVFKTVSETARAGLGRFDSYTPPPSSIAEF